MVKAEDMLRRIVEIVDSGDDIRNEAFCGTELAIARECVKPPIVCPMCEKRPQVERGNGCENLCHECFMAIPQSVLDAEVSPEMKATQLDLENEIARALQAKARVNPRFDRDTYQTLKDVAEIMQLTSPEAEKFDNDHPNDPAAAVIPEIEYAIEFLRIHIRDVVEENLLREMSFHISPLAMLSHLDLEFGRAYEIAAELLDHAVETESEVLP